MLLHLHRKSASLSMTTRRRLIKAICQAVCGLSSILASTTNVNADNGAHNISAMNTYVVPQSFRDALACQMYMLYTVMIFMESEIKADKSLGNTSGRGKNKSQEKERQMAIQRAQENRELCTSAMLTAANAMAEHKSNLWKRGVPDENVISLPCRIAYQKLENSSGVIARKQASADMAMQMIASTVDSTDCNLNTVVSALVDMLHSYEHMAPLVAELCCLVKEEPENKLGLALLREIGSLDASTVSVSDTSGKASGIRYVAPFLNELAEKKPQLVLEHISLILPHLRSEPYQLRSAIVVTIGHLLSRCDSNVNEGNDDSNELGMTASEAGTKKKRLEDLKASLYDILLEHAYDVSSYTRVAVMKTWATLIRAQSLPVDKLIPLTQLAIDRLLDKTVMVRRSAMQVSDQK